MNLSLRALLLFVLCLCSWSSHALQDPFANSDGEFLKVEEAYQVLPQVGDDVLRLEFVMAPGYYVYQHQFSAEAFNDQALEALALDFAPGKEKFDEFFNKELTVYYDRTVVAGERPKLEAPYQLKVVSQACADAGLCYPPRTQYFDIDVDGLVTEVAAASMVPPSSASGSGSVGGSTGGPGDDAPLLLFVILGALVGGFILNLMPCVFPVLSLKALSFASSHLSPHKQHLHGWAYTAGVTGSFLLAAVAILIARGAGESLGWGFQLQSPVFVLSMGYLFFIMGLSLSGLFHIGTSWMGAGQSLTSGSGLKSSFFTGVLAALVASPCTAPFMASALGFALTQPPYISLLVFAALGFGMALPFLALSYLPQLARYLPSPGPWMDTLKQVLAFPLYLTSVWLLWVLANQTSSDGAIAAVLGAVVITFAIWLFTQHPDRTHWRWFTRAAGFASVIFVAILTFDIARYREPSNEAWIPYTPDTLAELRSEGTPVFVDLTADWCITCKINEKVAFTEDVIKFAVLNDIALVQGDLTNPNPDISALLDEFGRGGVPLYLMYPAQPGASPEVLPQLLTSGLVQSAMERAIQ